VAAPPPATPLPVLHTSPLFVRALAPHRFVLDRFDARGEAKRGEGLRGVARRGAAVGHHGSLGVAAQGPREQLGEDRVPVGHVNLGCGAAVGLGKQASRQ